ncbi:hypothetical protein TrRE_jg4085 [Triparma retinervis]|uniref:AD domain-containing protein n=1 Tax=Triparma retinervis TaxID=2557542 RepID=A0A9W7FFC9_9STRA|nr:hypothetical protein TrRE_jg4085 [Triparma retinervis]
MADPLALEHRFPVTTPCTLTYPPSFSKPPDVGSIYCTDEISNTVTVKIALDYTTTSVKVTTLHLDAIAVSSGPSGAAARGPSPQVTLTLHPPPTPLTDADLCDTFPVGLRRVDLKKLQEREAYQTSLVEDAMKHKNDLAGPRGQEVFSVLLKACKEVRWTSRGLDGRRNPKGNVNIEVLGDIVVEEPYGGGDVGWTGKGEERGTDRIRMIVEKAGN